MITLVFMSVLLSWLWALVHYSLIVEVVLQVLVGVPSPPQKKNGIDGLTAQDFLSV